MIPIPDRLKKFPMHKGMLVHFTVFVGPDGVPDFRVVHEENRIKCMNEELCALCGQKLTPPMVFIGGAGGEEHRLFVDGPMHEECATYSTQVCPYLKNEEWQHADRKARQEGVAGVLVKTFSEVPISRPRMGMFYTTGYRLVRLKAGGPVYYQAHPFTKIDWNAMPQPKE